MYLLTGNKNIQPELMSYNSKVESMLSQEITKQF